MFIASIFHVWAIVATCIVALIAFIGMTWVSLEDEVGVVLSVGAGLLSSIVSMAIGFLIFAMVATHYSQQTFSNPHNEPNRTIDTKINKEVLNNTIAETIEADKVSIDLNNRSAARIMRDVKEGDIFDFTAIDDGSKINGSFYFTEDSLEIIVENEQQVKQEYSINTNE